MKRTVSGIYKAVFLLFSVVCLPFLVRAQETPFELSWESGTLVLTSGDTVRGAVTLTLPNDIVQVSQADGRISTFSATNVKSFQVRKELQSKWFSRRKSGPLEFEREYRSLMWNHDKDYTDFRSPAFFVLLQEGTLTLLMREIIERRVEDLSPYMNYPGSRQMGKAIVGKFYLLLPNQNIIPLRNPKKELPAAYPKKEKQILDFAKTNRLDFDDPIELSRIIGFANSLL